MRRLNVSRSPRFADNTRNSRGCRLVSAEPGVDEMAMDLRVWARPIEVVGEVFTVFSVVDISNEKRRQALERIFFHDVTNSAACVKGLAELIFQPEMTAVENHEMALMILESAEQLLEEISTQQMLSAAESGDLKPVARVVQTLELLAQVVRQFHSHSLAKGKKIVMGAEAAPWVFISDPILLRRVLTNLVKNALEASLPGGTVTLGAYADGEAVCFTVHNATLMPPQIRLQIFARSFSTKGTGRGLGTHSIKLISEKYLRGSVSFVSAAQTGTRFTVRYPRQIPAISVSA